MDDLEILRGKSAKGKGERRKKDETVRQHNACCVFLCLKECCKEEKK